MRLYECSVRFDKMQESGLVKKVTEVYLVDAFTFTEAETRIVKEISQYVSGELDVVAIKRTNYSEIVYDKFNLNSKTEAEVQKMTGQNTQASEYADKWFKAKVNYITIDEKTEKEKKTAVHFIINAGTVKAAHDTLVQHMKGTMADYEIATLDETRIMDVYVYSADGSQSVGVKEANSKNTIDNIVNDAKIQHHANEFKKACKEGGVEKVEISARDHTGKEYVRGELNLKDDDDKG